MLQGLENNSLAFTQDQWFHMELSIPVNQPSKNITLRISQKGSETQILETTSAKSKGLSWIGLMLSGKN